MQRTVCRLALRQLLTVSVLVPVLWQLFHKLLDSLKTKCRAPPGISLNLLTPNNETSSNREAKNVNFINR
jgi:hypothetical protein